MKIKIPILMLVLLILSACNNQAEENYQQLLTSFERNDCRWNKAFEETMKNIEEDRNRDKALHDINDKLIPQIEDFQQTVKKLSAWRWWTCQSTRVYAFLFRRN